MCDDTWPKYETPSGRMFLSKLDLQWKGSNLERKFTVLIVEFTAIMKSRPSCKATCGFCVDIG